jgi:hypothetical protein
MPTNAQVRARYEAARAARKRARARKDRAVQAALAHMHHKRRLDRDYEIGWTPPRGAVGRALPRDVHDAYPDAVIHLDNWREHYVRPLDELRLVGKSPRAKLARAASHLLARYPVPACVLDAFQQDDKWQHAWFVELGAGRSVRAVTSGFHLSKRAAHLFRSAPRALGPAGGAWWAKLRALGAEDELALAVAKLRLFTGEVSEDFLDRCAAFLLASPPARRDLGVLGAYLEGCWREDRGYRLKGKDVAKLVREARVLYGDAHTGGFFPLSGIDEVRTDDHRVVELRSPHALRVEGARMRHCVYEYRHRCAAGAAAIFSLRERRAVRVGRARQVQEKGVVTLEVWPRTRELVQARGPHNREPSPTCWGVIERFAALNGLKIPCQPPARRA